MIASAVVIIKLVSGFRATNGLKGFRRDKVSEVWLLTRDQLALMINQQGGEVEFLTESERDDIEIGKWSLSCRSR